MRYVCFVHPDTRAKWSELSDPEFLELIVLSSHTENSIYDDDEIVEVRVTSFVSPDAPPRLIAEAPEPFLTGDMVSTSDNVRLRGETRETTYSHADQLTAPDKEAVLGWLRDLPPYGEE